MIAPKKCRIPALKRRLRDNLKAYHWSFRAAAEGAEPRLQMRDRIARPRPFVILEPHPTAPPPQLVFCQYI